jgi:ParB family chromosome partitioning protein
MQKKVLGRGLRALIPDGVDLDSPAIPIVQSEVADLRAGGALRGAAEIDLDRIRENPLQPRQQMDARRLEGLAQSIVESGLIEPVIVHVLPDGFYEIVAGARRVAACRLAGRRSIPAIVRDTSRREMLEIALIENIQREDLTPIEEAEAYSRLHAEFGLSHEAIASKVGKERSTVTNSMRLLALPEDVRAHVSRGTLSAGHARALLGVDSSLEQSLLAKTSAERGLSVRQLEEMVRRRSRRARVKSRGRQRSATLDDLETRMQQWLSTQCRISARGKGGRIEIHYYSEDDLERVLERMGVLSHR